MLADAGGQGINDMMMMMMRRPVEGVDFVIPINSRILPSFGKRSCFVSVAYDDKLHFAIEKF